ncbi:MAG: tetratricopeptide repeat protein [Anaerolineae bacterium]|nr:tetratricopeptide repeat protein [Anaerolineae bacterium]
MPAPPTGTVTFLFTDIQGSTQLWERYPDAMPAALARHDAILRQTIETHHGYIFKTIGDAFCAAFARAPDALAAALAVQTSLAGEAWGEIGTIRVRMALHAGVTDERDGDYFGAPVNRVARLLAAGHGGQVLLSETLSTLVRDHLPANVDLLDRGEHRLRDLVRSEHIYQLVSPTLPADFPPLKTLDARPNNIPTQLTPLIGRTAELAALQELLLRETVRLITLTGPGGVGKTRLSVQVAGDVLDHFADGVFFVNLAPVTDPCLVVAAIAQTLAVREVGKQSLLSCLEDYLRPKHTLLILDNFEQALAAVPLVTSLLAAVPHLKLLVTSRTVLHVRGEQVFPVAPLPLPDLHQPVSTNLSAYPAIELFVQRAASARPDFALTPENAPLVAAICCHLDGLPLAIELAAARIRTLPLKAILARLSSSLKFLTGGLSDLPTRQQTLRSAILWSYDLLDASEQKLFRRLAVFAGGCTLEAAEHICDGDFDPTLDALEGVSSLVDKSLLRQEEEPNGEARFRMLETIREFALERLAESGEEDDERQRHAEYYLTLTEDIEPKLEGPDEIEWVSCLARESDNLRAALAWVVNGDQALLALRLVAALGRFWYLHGHTTEGIGWLRSVLAMPRGESKALSHLQARALSALGSLVYSQCDYRQATELHQQAYQLFSALDDRRGMAFALNNLGVQAVRLGDYPRAQSFLEQSRDLYQKGGDAWGVSLALVNLGGLAVLRGDHQQGEMLLRAALEMPQEARSPTTTACALSQLGECARVRGDYEQAAALSRDNLLYFEQTGDISGMAIESVNLAIAAQRCGRPLEAMTYTRRGVMLFNELGNKWGLASSFAICAELLACRGELRQAARLAGAAQTLLDAIGSHLDPSDQAGYEQTQATLHSQLGEAAFQAAWIEGQAMTLDAAVAYALEAGAQPIPV